MYGPSKAEGYLYVETRSYVDRFFQYMFFISTFYFIWRLVGEIFSTLITSRRIFQAHFLTFWALLDVVSTVMSCTVFIKALLVRYNDHSISVGWFRFFSLLVGILWLKFLSFLKVINPTLATFVLAMIQIVKDVKYLALILVMVILAFGDMFHILIRIDETACPVNPDPNNDENPFCKTGLSYLDVYAQILGNFDYGSFLGHPTTIILFIVMTLFGTSK
mmetsp:Transcript_29503/g.39237  ORF Transcript_29503/g.39237 Transcript_29503/m.39237 type:complete len:219 (+) Transcript_29503:212-868(+)